MILTQTKAIFLDAYRELNAKKLFWITMGLNLLVVVLFASLGINDKGVTLWHWTFDSRFMNTDNVSAELFYKLQFTSWGIPVWLSWATAILALISTASIFPDLVSGGMIEPVLSKPIGRVRLFMTKYLTGLLFVTLQVSIFAVGCLLVIGIRGGAWEPKLLLAVPIVLAFFSYLYAMCVLLGLVTRSTIAALLITLLFWFLIWTVNVGDSMMIAQREGSVLQVEDAHKKIESQERFAQRRIEQFREQGKDIPGENGVPLPEGVDDPLVAVNPTIQMARTELADAQASVETWSAWADRVFLLKTVLPKTQETVGLLERSLITKEEIAKLMGLNPNTNVDTAPEDAPAFADPRAAQRVAEAIRERSTLWVLGTSFVYEFIILGVCCVIFSRRDF